MKTLASLLLMSATLLGANAYAQELPGVPEYRPSVGQISSVTRIQVVREIRAVKDNGRVRFNEAGQSVADVAGNTVALEVVRVQAVTINVIGSYPSQGASHDTALRTVDEDSRGQSQSAVARVTADETTDEPVVAETSAVNVIGLYSYGDQSYKTAFSVVHAPRA